MLRAVVCDLDDVRSLYSIVLLSPTSVIGCEDGAASGYGASRSGAVWFL